MKCLLILGLILASSGIAQVIQGNAAASGGTQTTCAFPYSVTSGDIIVATSEWYNSANTPAVSDTLGTSFTQVEYKNAGPFAAAYVGTAGSTGADTITFTVSGASFQNTQCSEFSSQFMTATVGQHTNSATSGSPASVSLNLTTTKNGEVLFGVVGGFRSASSFSPLLDSFYLASASNGADSGAVSYSTSGTNGTYAVGFINSGSDQVTLLAFSLLPPSGITITSPATIPDGVSGTAYGYTFGAVGGTGAYTWSITAGSLQTGLSLSGGGVISGTPTATGSRTVTVSVTDGTLTQTKSITIGVGTSFSTITKVQSTSNGSGNSVAFGSNVVAGNTVIVNCGPLFGAPMAVNRPTDTLGTAFSLVGVIGIVNSTNWTHEYMFAGTLTSSGADTVTCQSIGNTYVPVIAEISGIGPVQDIFSYTTGSGLTTGTATSGTLTPQNPHEIIYATGKANSTAPTAVTAPFTSMVTISTEIVAYNIVSSTSGITNSYTLSGNSNGRWGILAGSFPASATSIPVNTSATQVGGFIVGP